MMLLQSDPPPIDPLVAGADRLAQILATAAGPAQTSELHGEDAAACAFRSARRSAWAGGSADFTGQSSGELPYASGVSPPDRRIVIDPVPDAGAM